MMNTVQIIREELSDAGVRELVKIVHQGFKAGQFIIRPPQIQLTPPLGGPRLELLEYGLIKAHPNGESWPYTLLVDELVLREALCDGARDEARFANSKDKEEIPLYHVCSDCSGFAIPGLFFYAPGIPLCTACYNDAVDDEITYLAERESKLK